MSAITRFSVQTLRYAQHLQAWRLLASNSTLSRDGLERAALCFGLNASIPLPEILR
jgi:hypothetical protein